MSKGNRSGGSWPHRVLVTGGAGFIGSHLCHRLVAEGCDVIAFDNLLTGRVENIQPLLGHERFTFDHYDVTNYLHIDGDLDAILHFASPASPADFERLPIQILKVGSLGTHKALGLAKAKGARFLLASTSECYGDPEVNPQPESYWGNVNPIGPRGVYDEAKRFAEAMTMAYNRYHGLDTRVVRIFNTYGPRMRPGDGRVVSNFIVQALLGSSLTVYGDGSQSRSFCYMTDEVEGIFRLFGSDEVNPVNIGNPTEYTIGQLAETVLEVLGSEAGVRYVPLPIDDPKVRRPDVTRAREILGWEARVPLREGLEKTIAYFSSLRDDGALRVPPILTEEQS